MLQHSSIRRSRLRKAAGILLFVCLLYALLLIPDPIPPVQTGAGKQPFLWARDAYWAALEKEFQQSRSLGCNGLAKQIEASLAEIGKSLEFLATTNVPPTAPVFATLETNVFHLGPGTPAGISPDICAHAESYQASIRALAGGFAGDA